MGWFSSLLDRIMRVVSWFLILVLGVMTVVLFLSVLSRYFLDFSIHWADPLARYGQVWIMLLGSAIALRKGMHIGVDNFVNKLPPGLRRWVLRFNVLLILIFSSTMTVQGFRLIGIAKDQIIPEMGVSMEIPYYMVPVAGALLVLSSIELLLRRDISTISVAEGATVEGEEANG